jgi:hypothetical protein
MLIPLDHLIFCPDCRGAFDAREHRACPGCGADGQSLFAIARWVDRPADQFEWEQRRGPA